jgi:hypothetical protein
MAALDPQQVVSISLPAMYGRGDDVLDFRVVTVIDSVIALDPVMPPDRFLPSKVPDCYLTLGQERRDQKAPIALKGHLYERNPGDWRFKVLDSRGLPRVRDERIRICAPITVSLSAADEDSEDPAFETGTVNIGVHGLMIECADGQRPPVHARLTFSLPAEDEPVELDAILVARERSLCDYSYRAMDPATVNRLATFIIKDRRASLRRRRSRGQTELVEVDGDFTF